MSNINVTDIQLFMRHRTKSLESILDEGSYNYSLIQPSKRPEHGAENTDFCRNVTNTWVSLQLYTNFLFSYA